MIVGTDAGAFICFTCGGVAAPSWSVLGTGLPNTRVQFISVTDDGSNLVAWTHGRGAWAIPLVSLVVTTSTATPGADTPFDVTVAAKQPNGSSDTAYRGTIHFTSSDPGSPMLPADYTFTAGDNGSRTFTGGVTLRTIGAQTVTATDTVPGLVTGTSSSLTVLATRPGPPSIPSGTAGDTAVSLTWSAPAHSGGVAITSYTVTPYIGATAQTPTITGSPATSAIVSGLSNGTAYTFTVAATNSVGTGPASAASNPITPTAGNQLSIESLGGVLTSGPASASWGPNRLDVFVRGSDNALYHESWAGTTWSGWESLGGLLTADPAAVSWGPNRTDVFVRGVDNQLWHQYWTGTAWSGWEPLGGGLISGPAVASWSSNRLDVFIRGTDNALWHKAWDGTMWRPWESLGGALTSAPGAVSWSPNRIDIVTRGVDSQVIHLVWTGTSWSGWEPLGGVPGSGPDVSTCASGHLDVLMVGADHVLYQKGWTGTSWTAWQSLGGQWSSDPSAVCEPGTTKAHDFIRGMDNALWHMTFRSS